MHQDVWSGESFSRSPFALMTRTPTLATIPLHSHHHVLQGLEAQLRQCWAMYTSLPSEANRYQLVRLERLLMEI
jgi:hypothetical protein